MAKIRSQEVICRGMIDRTWSKSAAMRVRRCYGANISFKTDSPCICVNSPILPSLLMSLDLSTVRIWSSTICPRLPSNSQGTLVGYYLPLLVIGATITVPMWRFISSGEMTRQGLLF